MSPVSESVRIGILGDFNPEFRSHHATNDSLQHAARKLQLKVESAWLPTPSLLEPGAVATLDSFDGLWASPGSPYKSFDGMLKGIEFARVHDRPFLGTCGGFQYALIECARNVLQRLVGGMMRAELRIEVAQDSDTDRVAHRAILIEKAAGAVEQR